MKDRPHDPSSVSQEPWRHFGALLRDRRNAAKLSRLALARRAQVSDATIKFIETARHPPSRSTLIRLLAVAELHLTWADVPERHASPEPPLPAPPTHAAPSPLASPLPQPIAPSPDPAELLMNLIGYDEIRLPPGAPKTLRIFQKRHRVIGRSGGKTRAE